MYASSHTFFPFIVQPSQSVANANSMLADVTIYSYAQTSSIATGEAEQGGRRGNCPPKLSNMHTVQYILDA